MKLSKISRDTKSCKTALPYYLKGGQAAIFALHGCLGDRFQIWPHNIHCLFQHGSRSNLISPEEFPDGHPFLAFQLDILEVDDAVF